MVALYTFYNLTARIQGTNQIWCLNTFSSKGLNISTQRIKKARHNLMELGLVESLVKKDKKTKKIEKHYVKLPYICTDNKMENLFIDDDWLYKNIPDYDPWDNPTDEMIEEFYRADLEEMGIL